jgi:hypothetical protein
MAMSIKSKGRTPMTERTQAVCRGIVVACLVLSMAPFAGLSGRAPEPVYTEATGEQLLLNRSAYLGQRVCVLGRITHSAPSRNAAAWWESEDGEIFASLVAAELPADLREQFRRGGIMTGDCVRLWVTVGSFREVEIHPRKTLLGAHLKVEKWAMEPKR